MREHEGRQLFLRPWRDVAVAHWSKYPNAQHCPHVISVDYLSRDVLQEPLRLRTVRMIGCQQPLPHWLRPLWSFMSSVFCHPPSSSSTPSSLTSMSTSAGGRAEEGEHEFGPTWYVLETSLIDPLNESLTLATNPVPRMLPEWCTFEEACHYYPVRYRPTLSPDIYDRSPIKAQASTSTISSSFSTSSSYSASSPQKTPASMTLPMHASHTMLHQRVRMGVVLPRWLRPWLDLSTLETFVLERFQENAERGRQALEDALLSMDLEEE
jgi:hypothetical protein